MGNHGNFLVGWTIPSTLVVVTTPAGAVANLRSIVLSASVCVCLCVCPRIYLRNHTRDLYQFFILVAYGRGSVFLRRGDDAPSGRGNFRGCPRHSKALAIFAAAFAAKGIIQSPITSSCRKDHSVCQASANSILKISGRRRCGLSAAQGMVGLHSASKVGYLRLRCCCCCCCCSCCC